VTKLELTGLTLNRYDRPQSQQFSTFPLRQTSKLLTEASQLYSTYTSYHKVP